MFTQSIQIFFDCLVYIYIFGIITITTLPINLSKCVYSPFLQTFLSSVCFQDLKVLNTYYSRIILQTQYFSYSDVNRWNSKSQLNVNISFIYALKPINIFKIGIFVYGMCTFITHGLSCTVTVGLQFILGKLQR